MRCAIEATVCNRNFSSTPKRLIKRNEGAKNWRYLMNDLYSFDVVWCTFSRHKRCENRLHQLIDGKCSMWKYLIKIERTRTSTEIPFSFFYWQFFLFLNFKWLKRQIRMTGYRCSFNKGNMFDAHNSFLLFFSIAFIFIRICVQPLFLWICSRIDTDKMT